MINPITIDPLNIPDKESGDSLLADEFDLVPEKINEIALDGFNKVNEVIYAVNNLPNPDAIYSGVLFKTTDPAPTSPSVDEYLTLIGIGAGNPPSGTYTNLLTAPNTPLVIPAAATNHLIQDARAYYNGTYWVPYWQDITVGLDPATLATKPELNAVQSQIATVNAFTYPAPMAFRLYTSQGVFVTTSSGVSQSDNVDTVTMSRTSGSANLHVSYFQTGHTISETTGYYKTIFTFNSVSTGNVIAPGIGCIRADSTAFGYVLRTKSSGTVCDLIKVDDYNVTLLDATIENFAVTDTIELRLIFGTVQQLAIYKNNVPVKTVNLPENLTGELCHCQRGAFSYNATKIKQYIDKLASTESVAANTTAINGIKNTVNVNYPFLKTATFLSQVQGSVGLDLSYLKGFIKDIKLFGFSSSDKISPFVVRRNSSTNANKWQIVFIKDNGDGTGISANRTTVMTWSDPTHVEPPAGSLDVIEYSVGGVGFKAYVDWTAVTVGDHGSANYNSAGFDVGVYINFKSSNIVAASGVRIMWPYNNTDAPTTGTNFYKGFTVLPNKNDANQTIGATGASYNIHTDEFVITRYEYERPGAFWFYSRKDLVDYSATGTINPVPTRIMPIPTTYAYHLQGNVYDPELKCYWLVGALNAVSSDTERVLVRIDNEGRMIEKYLLPYNTEAGMIVLSPDYQNILYKPNNSGTLYEFNKYTKALVRSQTGFNTNEGLGMDYDNKIVWISGDNGECKTYDYATLTLINSYTFATLPNTAGGTNTEGMVIINGMPFFIFDGYLHGSNNNGNAMFLFDFAHIIGKAVYFPNQMPLYNNGASGSVVVDFGASNNLTAATLLSGSGTLQYRGSDTAPSGNVVNRVNWLDRPFYAGWGTTIPSSWSATFNSFRYMEIKVV